MLNIFKNLKRWYGNALQKDLHEMRCRAGRWWEYMPKMWR